MSHLWCDFNYT